MRTLYRRTGWWSYRTLDDRDRRDISHGTREKYHRKIHPLSPSRETGELYEKSLLRNTTCLHCMAQGNSYTLSKYICYDIHRAPRDTLLLRYRYRSSIHSRYHRGNYGVHTVRMTTPRSHPCCDHRSRARMEIRSYHSRSLSHHTAYRERLPRTTGHEQSTRPLPFSRIYRHARRSLSRWSSRYHPRDPTHGDA